MASTLDSFNANITQSERYLRLNTPAGQDVLLVEHCVLSESISGLFSADLDLLLDIKKHRTSEVKPEDLLGRKVSIALALPGQERFISGIIKRLTQGHRDDRFQYYHAQVVPWTWLLTLKSDCQIFQDLTVPDIVKKIVDELKADYPDLVSYRLALTKQYSTWDYCVQYRETDYNFISRLLECEGISYFFEHNENGHTLVLADANSAFKPVQDNNPKFHYMPEGGYEERREVVLSINRQHEIRPGKWMLRDYHFEMPSKNLEKNEPTTFRVNNANLVLYDYPGEYAHRFNKPGARLGEVEPAGETVARVRMQEEESGFVVFTGSSNIRCLASGYNFEIAQHREMSGKYLVLSVQHSISQVPSYISGESGKSAYQNSFVCMPYSVPFVPRRLTPKPVVQGPQTAVVVGKQGEEIWVDKFGRVKVQFHWDRKGKRDENSSCWIRVSQPWAGKGWGGMWIPRIGQEVVVDFLEGDPDQPLITGRVYNSAQNVPYELPEHQTRSALKSRSSKGGGSDNFNELRFEDKKGSEQVFMHAERDMDLRVKKESREFVGHSRHLIVKQSQKEAVDGNKHLHVGGDHAEKIQGRMSLQVGTQHDEKVGTIYAVESGQEIHLKGGMKVIIEAGMQLTIKAAGGFVDIGPGGVTIQGILVNINSGGSAGTGTDADPKDPVYPDKADDGSKGDKL